MKDNIQPRRSYNPACFQAKQLLGPLFIVLSNIYIDAFVENTQLVMESARARRKWRLIRNCFYMLTIAKASSKVRQVTDINLLIKEVEELEVMPIHSAPTMLALALDTYRSSERLFQLVSRGAGEDLDEIATIVVSDPKRYLRDSADPENVINRRNAIGHTPLYAAALHGHLPVVRLLLDLNANPALPSICSGQEEYPLQVAARWGHCHIVEYFLKCCSLSTHQVRLALKSARPGPAKTLLKQKVPAGFKWLCCR
jgi:hypothetical protein